MLTTFKLKEVLGELAGSASLCWDPKPTGVFDATCASRFVDEAIAQLGEIARWHDQPPVPGIYYQESCDQYGNPRPGLCCWDEGKPWEPASIPTRYFGPIVGAMRPWETVPSPESGQ